ncbi:transcription factor Dp-1 [Nematocida homosporus]|uniref:transcription factor Dp-1 n=1 Tax=Nematocida homosporus TaxID=1912981 RepID=UPI00221EA806|nr:transcription factor Dp-1 [Nematocida homosporus]KAI5187293.1 transcription factor Dp-1 [Nematocida homosporus]
MNLCPRKERRGLKAFSAMILSILQKERSMDYARVAETVIALVGESSDDKNVRRRVYDALNVMCAADVIRKEKKLVYIVDTALCTCAPNSVIGETDEPGEAIFPAIRKIRERIAEKQATLEETKNRRELLLSLIKRNRERQDSEEKDRLYFPFILISTEKRTRVDCETNDRRSYFKFIFDNSYRIYEDVYILRKLFDKRETCHLLQPSLAGLCEQENLTDNIGLGQAHDKSMETSLAGSPPSLFTEEEDWLNLYNFLN